MDMVTIEQAKAHLDELISRLQPGETLLITSGDRTVAKISLPEPKQHATRRLGTMKGSIAYLAPDFDEPLEVFREYME